MKRRHAQTRAPVGKPVSFRRAAALAKPLAVAIAALGVMTALRIRKAAELCGQSRSFQASPAKATARLLLAGDSTAVGTGASTPDASVSGLIARHHPQTEIVNRAKVGARFADIVRQLDHPGRFDIILVLAAATMLFG